MIKFRLKSMNRNTKYSLEAWPCPLNIVDGVKLFSLKIDNNDIPLLTWRWRLFFSRMLMLKKST